MKKAFSVLSFLTSTLFSLNLVSALDLRQVSQNTVNFYVDFFEPILRALFGGQDYTGILLFEKLLFFIIFFCLVYLSMGKIPLFSGNRAIVWIVTISVALLGVRFVRTDWLLAVIAQYQVLAIVLTSILPFVLYFFFLLAFLPGDSNTFMRKLGWLLFIIVYAGLWSSAPDDIQGAVFFWTMIAAGIFAFFDRHVERYLQNRERSKARRSQMFDHITEIDRLIHNIHSYSRESEKDKRARIKELEEQRDYWLKQT